MELKEILKNEEKWLKRCTRMLTNVKLRYINNLDEIFYVDLTDPKFKEVEKRLLLRSKISEANKQINSIIVSRLNNVGLEVGDYISTYWSQINDGFASVDSRYNKASFYATFLSDRNSKLYRRFPDTLTTKSMKDYLMYLREYIEFVQETSHRSAIERAKAEAIANGATVDYADSLLPKNWSDICKQIKTLNDRAALTEEKQSQEDEERE